MRQSDFIKGLSDVWPMMLAYAPVAALWGTLAAAQGFSPLEAVMMSAFVYSGAAQFVALDLWKAATPLPLLVFAIATVSLRHALMSASVSRHIGSFPAGRASLFLFWLTDEAWAIIERRALSEPITPGYYFGVAFPIWPTWIVFSGLGAFLGKAMGDTAAFGLDFAFAALFISVVAGFWRGMATAAIVIASAGVAVAAKLYLPGAWYIMAGGGAGMLVAALVHDQGKPR